MVDGLEAIIAYLKSLTALTDIVGTRIANKHEYGNNWSIDDPSITVVLDAGVPDLYINRQSVRLEVRCYGTESESIQIWNTLVALARDAQRVTIPITGGNALIYWFYPSSGPSQLIDPDIDKPMIMSFFEMSFSEEVV